MCDTAHSALNYVAAPAAGFNVQQARYQHPPLVLPLLLVLLQPPMYPVTAEQPAATGPSQIPAALPQLCGAAAEGLLLHLLNCLLWGAVGLHSQMKSQRR